MIDNCHQAKRQENTVNMFTGVVTKHAQCPITPFSKPKNGKVKSDKGNMWSLKSQTLGAKRNGSIVFMVTDNT